jgi:hypothetical protein
MSLTKEVLLETKQLAVQKRQQLYEMLQQANGAIEMVDFLLSKLEEPEQQDAI